MTPEQFIAKWRPSTRTERSAAHEHFLDLCELLEVPKPGDIDPHGTEYTFDRLTKRLGRGRGYADAWKKDCFEWEYKGPRKNLVVAYAQLKQYADDLGNPPLLIVSDTKEIRVHTNFTGQIGEEHVIRLAELVDPKHRQLLRRCFLDPYSLKPTITREGVTAKAAARFARIAVLLRRKYDERRVAHFVNKLVFCLFAEDIGLLQDRVFAVILEESETRPEEFAPMLRDLFRAMAKKGGRFGAAAIPWFNGGLFDDDDVLEVGISAVSDLIAAARLDWGAIDPTIFGTLFESSLDEKRRAEMASLFDLEFAESVQQGGLFDQIKPGKGVGIDYTDPGTIRKIIEPTVLRPLKVEWDALKAQMNDLSGQRLRAKSPTQKMRLLAHAREGYAAFRTRLGKFRVLDPACGSGNFLAIALSELKDFDLTVLNEARAYDLPPDNQRVGPEAVLGIEINAYAAELARLTVWIAELQWQLRSSFGVNRSPILGKLDGVVCRDAIVNSDGSEASWPRADVVIGNPPFLGDKLMRRKLGEDYTRRLRGAYAGRVPAGADLVCYWFEKARNLVASNQLQCVGLVATNSIRGGANRTVLDRIHETGAIFDAWSDQPWVVDGAAVRVSLVCFSSKEFAQSTSVHLDGGEVTEVYADLTSGRANLTRAKPLSQNARLGFNGISKKGKFEIRGSIAREWLRLPLNPNGRPNSDVIKPWINGLDITRRPLDNWIIDFGERTEAEAALYEQPFAWVRKAVQAQRLKTGSEGEKRDWWLLARRATAMNGAVENFERYIVVPETSQHRMFVFVSRIVVPDKNLVVIARDDYTMFGILQSRFHVQWSLRMGTSLESRPRYTSKSTVRTFPFPEGLTPDIAASLYDNDGRAIRISEAGRVLDELRCNWLNPSDFVQVVADVLPSLPDRILPRDGAAAVVLKNRTLTKLYNEPPAWLDNAHRELDAAVAEAYGWPADITDDEAMLRLLSLNRARSDNVGVAAK